MTYITTSDTILTLLEDKPNFITANKIKPSSIPKNCFSLIGNVKIANDISSQLGFTIPANDAIISINEDDIIYIVHDKGPILDKEKYELLNANNYIFYKVEFK